MKKCIFPGSFNPFHEGHINVIKSAIDYGFDHIYIVIAQNPDKIKNSFDTSKILELLTKHSLNSFVTVIVEKEKPIPILAKEMGIGFIIRGYRNKEDYKYEVDLKNLYLKYNDSLEFLIFECSDLSLKEIRSSKIK
ncbi:MAG: adenylyltransferase/cytidyltransferase family protein [Mycoplasma sp.]